LTPGRIWSFLVESIRGLVGIALLGLLAAPSWAAEGVRVAVLPVLVHSDGPEDYLRAGLADMLASRLDQQAGVEVVRVEDPERATVDIEAARAAATALGADFVLFGSFTHFGEGASLDLACAPVSEGRQAPREIFVQSGTLGEIIPRLSELAQKIARYLEDPTAPAPVSAPPPQAGSDDLLDALSELDELRARVGALEGEVFEPPAAIPEEDLRAPGVDFEGATQKDERDE
jgi:hypothetical protein